MAIFAMNTQQTDTHELTSKIDLAQLAGVPLRGGEREKFGPCPKCGGDDRFHIRHHQGRDYFFCRKCHEKRGDAIEFMRWMHGYTFPEAVRQLGGDPAKLTRTSAPKRLSEPQPVQPPNEQWRVRAALFVDRCEAHIWTTAGHRARRYLNGRGLNDATIKKYRLGLNPRYAKTPGGEWGLDRDVTRAMGITIPRYVFGELWAVNIRRLNDDQTAFSGDNKYLHVTGGSVQSLFNCDAISAETIAAVATGGEFDAMLCQQHAPAGVACVSLGSEGYGLKPPFRAMVENVPIIRVAYDADDAGAAGAFKWIDLKTRVKRAKTPAGKDATEYYQSGGDIGAWISEITGTGHDDIETAVLDWLDGVGYAPEIAADGRICAKRSGYVDHTNGTILGK